MSEENASVDVTEELAQESVDQLVNEDVVMEDVVPVKPKKTKSTKKVVKAVVETPSATKKAAVKKTVAKEAPAPKAKKETTAKSNVAAKKRAVLKDGVKSLSKAQVSILRVLAKYGPLVGQEIAKRAGVNSTMIGSQAGYRKEEINERPVHQWNLTNRKFVKLLVPDEDSHQFRYAITPLGVKALAKE